MPTSWLPCPGNKNAIAMGDFACPAESSAGKSTPVAPLSSGRRMGCGFCPMLPLGTTGAFAKSSGGGHCHETVRQAWSSLSPFGAPPSGQGVCTVPQRSAFDPELVAMMGRALDEAWAEVEARGWVRAEPEKTGIRRALALRIISAVRVGQRDPQRLRDVAPARRRGMQDHAHRKPHAPHLSWTVQFAVLPPGRKPAAPIAVALGTSRLAGLGNCAIKRLCSLRLKAERGAPLMQMSAAGP